MDAGTRAITFDDRTGRIVLEFEKPGQRDVYTLLPPSLGSLRALYEEADRIDAGLTAQQETQIEEAAPEGETAEDDTPTVTLLTMIGAQWVGHGGGMEHYFAWWRKCFELCEADAKPLPKDEDCPVWLASVSLHVRVLTHWLQFPTLAPGISAPSLGVSAAAANGAG